ncbi:MAG: sulfatase [Planctomycetota bacterium]
MRAFLIWIALATAAAAQPEQKPTNIVLIVADDLGWTDLTVMGSDLYRTPNVDSLAAEGLLFTDAYSNGPNCAPSRACLITGLYSPRHGIHTVGSAARGRKENRTMRVPVNVTKLDTRFVTLAERLREAGYRNGHFGKWHLGPRPDYAPGHRGFDVNVGGNHVGHPASYFSPYKNPNIPNGPEGEFLTDRLTDEAIRFIRSSKDRPFFVYLPYYAVHTPLQAPEADIEAVRERPRDGRHRHLVYTAMVERMDTGIGRILETLEELELEDDTLVVFTSDNGGLGGYAQDGIAGTRSVTNNAPLRGGKGMLTEGGIRVPMIARWPGHIRAGRRSDEPVMLLDLHPTLLDVAGAEIPDALDGVSLRPIFEGADSLEDDRALFWHFPAYLEASAKLGTWRTTPAGAIRHGRYKLIEYFVDGHLELYDLEEDIGENHDLAAEEPERAAALHGELVAWRASVNAAMPSIKQPGDEDDGDEDDGDEDDGDGDDGNE